MRARAGLRDLLYRTTEVHVDDVRSGGDDHPRRVGHDPRVGAEDLDRQGMLVRGDPQIPERLLVSVLDPSAGHHFRAYEPRAVAAALAPKRLDAHPRHRGKDDAGWDLDIADPPRFAQVHHEPAMVSGHG